MEFTLDLHTHTVASGHAYSTVQEMAKQTQIKDETSRHHRTCTRNSWNMR